MKTEAIAKKVDKKGRLLIPDLAGAMVLVEKVSPGEYLVKAAELVPAREAWIYKNTKAKAMLERGLEEAKKGKLLKDNSADDMSWIHELKDE